MHIGRLVSVALFLLRATWSVVRADEAATAPLDEWKATVRQRFPDVKQLSTDELAGWLSRTNGPSPVLLDVRTPPEFAVSHLPGAVRVDPKSKPSDIDPTLPADRPVVVYCSVGWRSSELAERLRRAGRTNVFNLEGSIFAWANEGRPLEAAGRPVHRVHPYNRTFGRLLKPALRADEGEGR